VSRDSVRILLTIAALNELDILGADVQNTFLTAPNKEKYWMIARPEFGPKGAGLKIDKISSGMVNFT
jgi:hypothetical protein